MSECCKEKVFEGLSPAYKRALIAVIAINGVMFAVEMLAGINAGSQALKADALDFGADMATYTISLAVIGASIRVRASAALLKGISLVAIAGFILVTTFIRYFGDAVPEAQTISVIGFLALLANVISVIILVKWSGGDSNVRSVWLCTRNDAIGNIGVIMAGIAVGLTNSALPDLIVATLLATLFLKSATSILYQAISELRGPRSSR